MKVKAKVFKAAEHLCRPRGSSRAAAQVAADRSRRRQTARTSAQHGEQIAPRQLKQRGIGKSLPGCLVSSVPSGPSRPMVFFRKSTTAKVQWTPRCTGTRGQCSFQDVHSLCPPFYCPVSSTLQFGV
ncbi:hypothetical protein ACRRTK_009386 [Alexandromys fortis]